MPTFGSLFSGIGGIDLGLERAGWSCVWQVENDKFCNRILAKHWPNVVRYDDVRTFLHKNPEHCDLIAGGFPCQDISSSGGKKGVEAGEKSGLWAEFAIIIRELRPHYVLVENVAALTARGLGRVLGDLAEIGYDAEWFCLPASWLGAPQRRDRLFIIAYIARIGWETMVTVPTIGIGRKTWEWRGGGDLQSIFSAPFQQGERWPPPLVRGVDGRIPYRMDRIRAVGNSVVPDVAEWIGKAIMRHYKRMD